MAAGTKKRTAAKRTVPRKVQAVSHKLIKVTQTSNGLYTVVIGTQHVVKPVTRAMAQKIAQKLRRRAQSKRNPAMDYAVAAEIAREMLVTFDVDADGELDRGDIRTLRAAARTNPSRSTTAKKSGTSAAGRYRASLMRLARRTANSDDLNRAVKDGMAAGLTHAKAWAEVKKAWNAVSIRYPKRNPGLISTLAEIAVGASAALDIKDRMLQAKKKKAPAKKRTPAKKTVRGAVLNGSPNKKPVAKKKNPVTKSDRVRAYEIFHAEGLTAAKTFVQKSRQLNTRQKQELMRDLRDYNKPPTINPRGKGKKPVRRTRRNIDGFIGEDGNFHPIRSSEDYDDVRAGEYKAMAPKRLSKAAKARKAAEKKPAAKKAAPTKKAVTARKPSLADHVTKIMGGKAWYVSDRTVKSEESKGRVRIKHSDYDKLKRQFDSTLKTNSANKRPVTRPAKKNGSMVASAKKKLPVRNSAAYQAFQGRPSTKTIELATSPGTPRHVYALGRLIGLRIKGYDDLNFEDRRFYLVADEQNRGLHIAGGTITGPTPSLPDGQRIRLGTIKAVIYRTEKAHLDDEPGKPSTYIHHFGDEGGQRPTLSVDNKGWPFIEGGDYQISPEGIRD